MSNQGHAEVETRAGEAHYLSESAAFYAQWMMTPSQQAAQLTVWNWDNQIPGLNVLLAKLTAYRVATYTQAVNHCPAMACLSQCYINRLNHEKSRCPLPSCNSVPGISYISLPLSPYRQMFCIKLLSYISKCRCSCTGF